MRSFMIGFSVSVIFVTIVLPLILLVLNMLEGG